MNLCSEGHDEVCYDGRDCPACLMYAEDAKIIDARDEEIDDLKAQILELENRISDLGADLDQFVAEGEEHTV